MRLTEVFIFLMVIYIATATKCIIKEKDDPEIHIIHLEDESNSDSSGDPEVIGIHIPDRRKREVWNGKTKVFCKTDKDCDPGEKCFGYLRCVKPVKKIKPAEEKSIEHKTKI